MKLIKSGAVASIAESSSPATNVNHNTFGLKWRGKDPTMEDDLANFNVTPEYGKTDGLGNFCRAGIFRLS